MSGSSQTLANSEYRHGLCRRPVRGGRVVSKTRRTAVELGTEGSTPSARCVYCLTSVQVFSTAVTAEGDSGWALVLPTV